MSDLNDNNTSDAASRTDELVSAIRTALASDASPEVRATGASACRAILRGLEPAQVRNAAPPSSTSSPAASMLAGTPLGAALGALNSIPREQILELIASGLRAVLGHGSPPTYRPAPVQRPPDTTERSG
jgi:hypothetical protein